MTPGAWHGGLRNRPNAAGASSFFGLMVEFGPFFLSQASLETREYNRTGVPTLFLNEYRWTKVVVGGWLAGWLAGWLPGAVCLPLLVRVGRQHSGSVAPAVWQ